MEYHLRMILLGLLVVGFSSASFADNVFSNAKKADQAEEGIKQDPHANDRCLKGAKYRCEQANKKLKSGETAADCDKQAETKCSGGAAEAVFQE